MSKYKNALNESKFPITTALLILYVIIIKKFFRNKKENKKQLTQTFFIISEHLKVKQKVCKKNQRENMNAWKKFIDLRLKNNNVVVEKVNHEFLSQVHLLESTEEKKIEINSYLYSIAI